MQIPKYTAVGIKLYKYTTLDAAKNILLHTKLRWRSPSDFNDPFDISGNLGLSARAQELQREIVQEIASLIKTGSCPGNIRSPKLRYILQMMSLHSESVRAEFAKEAIHHILVPATEGQILSLKAMEEEWAKTVHRMRVLCLSERNDVPPMWAHYADKGKGVVLEFKGTVDLDSPFLIAQKVRYSQTPPAIMCLKDWVKCSLGSSDKEFEDLYREVQYVKTTSWEYEKEWRIVTVDAFPKDMPYSDLSFFSQDLQGIYFGYSCGEKEKKDLLEILASKYAQAKAYSANLHHYNQTISFTGIK